MKPISEIPLPESSSNEELEIKSRKKFEALFDEQKYILKPEIIDNGVDYRIELKLQNKKLGFGINIQLKSKEKAIENNDGSYSKTIETKNIHYLLNNGQPTYYVFYISETDQFYFEHLNEIIKSLEIKNSEWDDQPNHTIRFHKTLDANAINEIYKEGIGYGNKIRDLNIKTIYIQSNLPQSDNIMIDVHGTVITENEIRSHILDFGIQNVNKANWKYVIEHHEKTTSSPSTNPKYNFIIGISYYYIGKLMDSLTYLNRSFQRISELQENLKEYLYYHLYTIKFTIGIYNESQYSDLINNLALGSNLALHLKYENAKRDFTYSNDDLHQKVSKFANELNSIMNDTNANSNIRLICGAELIFCKGIELTQKYIHDVSTINFTEANFGMQERQKALLAEQFHNEFAKWYELIDVVRKEAYAKDHKPAYYISILNEVKSNYHFEVYSDHFFIGNSNALTEIKKKETPFFDLSSLLLKLNPVIDYFTDISHVENIIVSLSLKYEILHYLGLFKESSIILVQMESLLTSNHSNEIQTKFHYLKDKGTFHEGFSQFMTDYQNKIEVEKNEIQIIEDDLKKMDEQEAPEAIEMDEQYYTIQLFPIGYFNFPKYKLKEVLENLDTTVESQQKFKSMFDYGVIPTCNLFFSPVESEGPQDGFGDADLNFYKRIFKIRKYFYDNKFYRDLTF